MKRHSLRAAGKPACLLAALLLLSGPPAPAADGFATPDADLDALSRALGIAVFDGQVRAQVSGLLDLEGYALTRPAPALIETGHALLFNPRLSFFLDVNIGPDLYGFMQVRIDRGFDPTEARAEARLDEYFLRYTLANGKNFSLAAQAGKFATVAGNWTPRHLSWDNAFINAPLPYENATTVSDSEAPDAPDEVEFVRGSASEKYSSLPVIWGPSYASGLALAGQAAHAFDYAFEVKNAALSSRPETWSATGHDWSRPTFSGRLGWRPSPDWNLGASGSGGAYLTDEAAKDLRPGRSLRDYRQYTLGQDLAYAHGHLQLWAEAYESRFQVPNVGNADTLVYYLEAKYKFTPGVWGGLRWNQQLFGDIPDGSGGEEVWGNDLWRSDVVFGYRVSEHFQFKLQYSFGRAHDPGGERNSQLGAAQLTTKF